MKDFFLSTMRYMKCSLWDTIKTQTIFNVIGDFTVFHCMNVVKNNNDGDGGDNAINISRKYYLFCAGFFFLHLITFVINGTWSRVLAKIDAKLIKIAKYGFSLFILNSTFFFCVRCVGCWDLVLRIFKMWVDSVVESCFHIGNNLVRVRCGCSCQTLVSHRGSLFARCVLFFFLSFCFHMPFGMNIEWMK